MKILHLVGQLEDDGGVLTVIRNLVSTPPTRSWSHVVWVNQAFVEIRRPPLTYRFSRFGCADHPSLLRLAWSALRALIEVKRLLDREPCDVIHAHSRGGLLVGLGLAAWQHRPVLFTNHNYARRKGCYRWAAHRRRLTTVLLTPNMARHYGLEAASPKVRIIPACCADAYLTRPLGRPTPGTGSIRPVRLAGVGTLLHWKKWHLLLEAVSRLAPAERARLQITVWGPHPHDPEGRQYARELDELIATRGLSATVCFSGPAPDVSQCLNSADWFVLPSTNEPCSVALIEALASGLPALVSASGGNLDLVQPGRTGRFFRPDDPADLADQLRGIVAGQDTLAGPDAIRESVRQRSASAVAVQYAEIYAQLSQAGQAGHDGLTAPRACSL